jgi:hypothetical protein
VGALVETDFFKAFGDCYKKLDSSIVDWPTSAADIGIDKSEQAKQIASLKEMLKYVDAKVNFWVSPWEHKPTRLLINFKMKNDSNDVDFTIDTTRKGGKTEIKMPSDSTSLKSVIEDLQIPNNSFDKTIEYDYYDEYDDYTF